MFHFETRLGKRNASFFLFSFFVTEKSNKGSLQLLAFFPNMIKNSIARLNMKPNKDLRAEIMLKTNDTMRANHRMKPSMNLRFNLARVGASLTRSINYI